MFKGRPEDVEQSYACKIETTHILLMRYFHQEMYTYLFHFRLVCGYRASLKRDQGIKALALTRLRVKR